MNKSILVLDVISQVVSALLVVSGPSEHGRQRLLSFTHAGGLEPEWRPMHELFVCSHYVPFDNIYIYIHCLCEASEAWIYTWSRSQLFFLYLKQLLCRAPMDWWETSPIQWVRPADTMTKNSFRASSVHIDLRKMMKNPSWRSMVFADLAA